MYRSFLLVVAVIGVSCLSSCQKAPRSVLDQAEANFRAGRWNTAISDCNKHLAGEPNNARAISLRGRSLLALKQYDAAVTEFTKLIELQPEECDAWYRRSMAYEAMGQDQLASEDRRQARALDPMREPAYQVEPGVFIRKPSLDSVVEVESSNDEADADDPTSNAEGDRSSLDANADKLSALERELDQDFYQRAEQAENAELEAELKDAFPSTARQMIRSGEIDEDMIRDSVTSFRRLQQEDSEKQTSSARPKFATSAASRTGASISLDDLLGPEKPAKDENESDQEPTVELPNNPVSTALPSGYGGLAGGGFAPSAVANPGLPTRLGLAPRAGSTSLPTATNLGNPARPGGISIPGGLRVNPGRLHGNTINQPGSQPQLSTTIPTDTGFAPLGTAVNPQLGNSRPGGTNARLPSMIPRTPPPQRPIVD